MADLRLAALGYAARGRPVFPLHGLQLGFCMCSRRVCSNPGKHPLTPRGLDDATLDPERIRAWWAQWPSANIGLRTGDGLVVLDVDDHRPPEGLPLTPTVESGKGVHLYFTTWEPVGNAVALVPGVDLRGERGYVVAPPSRHVSGSRYQWRVTLAVPLAALPPWVLKKMAEPRTHALREQRHNNTDPTPDSADSVIPEGRRNDTLWRLGRKLRFKGWSPESIATKLHKVNREQCRPPLDVAEVEHMIRHILSHPS
jgi:hypothetical protein